MVFAFIGATLSGLFAFQFLSGFDFSFSPSAVSRLEHYAGAQKKSITDRVGDSLIDRFGLSLRSWGHELLWAQLGGYYEGKTVGSVLGQSILFAAAGMAIIFITGAYSAVYAGGVALAAYYPYMKLHGKANSVRDAVKRSLPEAATLIAAEMNAGSSAETSVARATSLPGPLGNLLRQVTQSAQQAGRLVFSRDATLSGALIVDVAEYGMPQLDAFAQQIDLVASKGADGPRQMDEVARSLAREYRSDVAKAAESLDAQLLLPTTLYIFIPFMLAIFVPFIASLFTAF
jgi:tight adherence protein C